MYKGEPIKGKDFFNLLLDSKDFTTELGKVTLAAGMLEAELILFLKRNGIDKNLEKSTFGNLIKIGKDNGLFEQNMVIALERLLIQRNYLTHNIYALFIDLIDETMLGRNDLLDSDVTSFTDTVWQLKKNLLDLADIFQEKNEPRKKETDKL